MASKSTVLVTGGAGYIGSHVVLALRDAGWPVIVLDDLSTGHRQAVPEGVVFAQGDVGDRRLLGQLFERHAIDAVVHLAGSISVPESMARPLEYYRNNTLNSHTLIEASVAAGVGAWIFSSTAAVYGDPDAVPVAEDAPTRPLNPYGRSKLMTEQMLIDAAAAHRLPHVILRYFNVAGADPAGRAGPATPGAAHLLKVACEAAVGKRASVPLYGEDYPTADGTCVRDFIHVSDLAEAHVKALGSLLAGGPSAVLNCGYGRGFSVREVLDAVARACGRPLVIEAAPRRPGDAVEVVAAAGRIRAALGWQPRYDDLDQIVGDALAFERRLQGLTEGTP
jgi:UDP-glucose 4-epimerase